MNTEDEGRKTYREFYPGRVLSVVKRSHRSTNEIRTFPKILLELRSFLISRTCYEDVIKLCKFLEVEFHSERMERDSFHSWQDRENIVTKNRKDECFKLKLDFDSIWTNVHDWSELPRQYKMSQNHTGCVQDPGDCLSTSRIIRMFCAIWDIWGVESKSQFFSNSSWHHR